MAAAAAGHAARAADVRRAVRRGRGRPELGLVRVRRLVGAFAPGRVLNPQLARSQLMGGMLWGMSQALLEGNHMDPRYGRWAATNLGEYLVPVNADAPEVRVELRRGATTNWSARSASRAWARSARSVSRPPSPTRSSTRPAAGSAAADGAGARDGSGRIRRGDERSRAGGLRGARRPVPAPGTTAALATPAVPARDRRSSPHSGCSACCSSSRSRWRWRSARGGEGSMRVLAPLVTFSLPLVVMIAFWWEDWPGTRLRSSWSGWADTVLIAAGAIVLTVAGQALAGRPRSRGPVRSLTRAGPRPTFPATLPLAGLAFVAHAPADARR